MASTTEVGANVMASIGLAMTLSEYFPDKLWEELKRNTPRYNSVLSLILNALHAVGFNEKAVLAFIVDNIAGQENVNLQNAEQKFAELKEEFFTISGNTLINSDAALSRLTTLVLTKSKFLQTMESIVKVLIEITLAGIFSCSMDPLLPDYGFSDGFIIPLEALDPTGMLKTAPESLYGKYEYFDGGYAETTDFNAFLWYVINRADAPTKWYITNTDWLFEAQYLELTDSIKIVLNPERYHDKRRINVPNVNGAPPTTISFNKTLYEFNHDYLKSQILYNPNIIVGGILKTYIDATKNLEIAGHVSVNMYEKVIEAKISQIIKNIMESDEETINDCFYSFSNDDYNAMLEEMELSKIGGIPYNDGVNNTKVIDKDLLMDNLANLNTITGNLEEYKNTLTATITDVIVKPGEEAYIDTELDVRLPELDTTALIDNLIQDVVVTCSRVIMSPKVLALILINYGIMGFGMPTAEQLIRWALKIIVKVVRKILEYIVNMLVALFQNLVMPIIAKLKIDQLIEQINDYLELLTTILKQSPFAELSASIMKISLGFQKAGLLTEIDNVTYADILPTTTNNNIQNC